MGTPAATGAWSAIVSMGTSTATRRRPAIRKYGTHQPGAAGPGARPAMLNMGTVQAPSAATWVEAALSVEDAIRGLSPEAKAARVRRLDRARSLRYKRTPKGRAAQARYERTARGKATQLRYNRSQKGKVRGQRYYDKPTTSTKRAIAYQWRMLVVEEELYS